MDIEKVIRGLECCAEEQNCKGCPYVCFDAKCQDDMNRDVLSLLKEQQQIVRCKDCKWWNITSATFPTKGCCGCYHGEHEGDWYCADGERKD